MTARGVLVALRQAVNKGSPRVRPSDRRRPCHLVTHSDAGPRRSEFHSRVGLGDDNLIGMLRIFALVITAMLLVSCGGGGGGGAGGSGSSDYDTPKALADAVGCTGYEAQKEAAAPGDVGVCQLGGEQVSVLVGKNAEQRDAALEVANKAAEAFGTEPGFVVAGGTWAVRTESEKVAKAAQEKVGGELRTAEVERD